MKFNTTKYTIYLIFLFIIHSTYFYAQHKLEQQNNQKTLTGTENLVENFSKYENYFRGKRVGVVSNQTGMINEKHIVDVLIEKGVNITTIFSPEHGFRGEADAGETILNQKDIKTGIPIISLYGKNKKPSREQIKELDLIIFDIQDIGVRFYTYISTLTYIMEAAAENNKKVIILDRPNPNAHYIDGPLLKKEFKSYVGMHPVPIIYGLTIGEYGKMVNGEKWLANKVKCDLTVIKIQNYTHQTPYSLPIKPSPNLPNDLSINLYPSLCFFEGTNVSEGRGTEKQFQLYGSPYLKNMNFSFVPKPNFGAKNPRYNGVECFGEDLTQTSIQNKINLTWLFKAYKNNSKTLFFTQEKDNSFWIDKLYGSADLRLFIEKGYTQKQIEATWQKGLENFKKIRAKYLLYP